MAEYTLPDLRYDYGALEPHISGKIMELHHDKHHAAYVKGANKALEQMAEAREKDDFTRIAALEKALAFNLSGHVLHSLFWTNLTPKGGDRPHGELAAAIDNDLGGFERFQKQMVSAASTIMGSGWAALTWDPLGQRLMTVQIYDHQSNVNQGGAPILVLDAWEHAFYLQYQNRKEEFFQAVWNVWNWEDAAKRFDAARGKK
ncbi:MAG: superoxide dismutase [Acidobacteriota bacterium]|nr:superoxide dismutase [Acidobacteriota bacterium]